MKTDIDFLPDNIKSEILEVTKKIIDEFNPEKIILFGSFARNDWVDDSYIKDGIRYTYTSDYDILVITIEELTDKQIYKKLGWVERYIRSLKIKRSVSIICHDIQFINDELRAGGYFFSDIIKEGISLHNANTSELVEVGAVDPELVKKRAKEDYEFWMNKASMFNGAFENDFEKGKSDIRYNSQAAFYLHQITESLYAAFLLAFTNYKPKTHDLEKLGKEAAKINKEFLEVFPKDTDENQRCFKLLQKGYVDARYEKDYKISTAQLEYLNGRIIVLKQLIQRLVETRIEE